MVHVAHATAHATVGCQRLAQLEHYVWHAADSALCARFREKRLDICRNFTWRKMQNSAQTGFGCLKMYIHNCCQWYSEDFYIYYFLL